MESQHELGHRLRRVIDQTIADMLPYYADDGTDRPDGIQACNPNRDSVVRAHRTLIDALLPGRLSPDHIQPNDFDVVLMRHLSKALRLLRPEVEHVLPLRWLGEAAKHAKDPVPNDCAVHEESFQVMDAFFATLPKIRQQVIEDVRAAYNGDPAALTYAEVHLTYPGLLAIVSHRLAHELYKLDVPVIPRLMSEWAHGKTGVDIHPGATIGHGFFMDHGTGIVIGETAEIGNNVKLYQGVTLGARSFPLDEDGNPIKHIKRHPTVEDDVIIYASAAILGGDTIIGKGSTIGGNVFLMESVPPNSFVTQRHPELSIKQQRKA